MCPKIIYLKERNNQLDIYNWLYEKTCLKAEGITDKLIVYKNIFQEDKIFAREESQLAEQLEESKQKEFEQKYRVEKLTQEEIEMIKTEEFIKAKKEYMKEVR